MAAQNFLIMNLLRLITPEEIGDIATKHNGGKFLSLNDLVTERVEHNVHRDFSRSDSMNEIHESHATNALAKILPFKNREEGHELVSEAASIAGDEAVVSLTAIVDEGGEENCENEKNTEKEIVHNEGENMSSFILIEKERLKRSQHVLKQKEIIDLYQKNSNVDVEQIKGSNKNRSQDKDAGVLVNKKHY